MISDGFIATHRITPYIINTPAIRRLSCPAGYEWMRDLHDSNMSPEAKAIIVSNHHQSEIMEKILESQLQPRNNNWLIPLIIILPTSIFLILRGLM